MNNIFTIYLLISMWVIFSHGIFSSILLHCLIINTMVSMRLGRHRGQFLSCWHSWIDMLMYIDLDFLTLRANCIHNYTTYAWEINYLSPPLITQLHLAFLLSEMNPRHDFRLTELGVRLLSYLLSYYFSHIFEITRMCATLDMQQWEFFLIRRSLLLHPSLGN